MPLRNSAVGMVLLAGTTLAANAEQPVATFTMAASGEIQIAADGHVSDYKLRSQLPEQIAALVDRSIRQWMFNPIMIDGQAVPARTAINLSLGAEPVDKDSYKIRVVAVHFGGPTQSRAHTRPPRYPASAVRAQVGGKVLLAVRLDDTGKVIEALPYQTSLDVRTANEREARDWRKILENASIDAARHWKYDLTETVNGKPMGTSAIVPVVFAISTHAPRDGHWKGYIPGPIEPVPWMSQGQLADNQAASDLKDGESLSLDSRFKLKNDIIGKTL
ncbi:MAG: hypothetical protein JSS59_05050 [Proteobacteria bacterium]|uniref:hypothetical protein n=1 Tax=Rudaea sp. TaxID=2136325 RepID=UPI003783631F|nr:hypothetical protein [Pseudomonadota bacterium]